MSNADDGRPKTASRPRTARPMTSAGQAEQWPEEDDDYDEDDDDVGMFSFARPGTGEAAPGASAPSTSAPYTPYTTSSPYQQPYSPFQFAYSPYGSAPPSTAAPSEAPPPTGVAQAPALATVDEALPISAAAAYAQRVQAGEPGSPDVAPSSPEPQVGPRKRGSWQSSGSPTHVVGNPYEEGLQRQSTQRTSESSPDKADALSSGWADQSMRYAVDENGQAIMLDEMGEPLRLATTAEQKMIAEATFGTGVPYTDRSDNESYVEEEDSPYPEVRASVSNYDDPDMPVLTFRSWTIGLVFCIVISAVNCFFNLRYPAPLITPIITQVLSYPIGKLFARFLPYKAWNTPAWMHGYGMPKRASLNPGPFNIKEHTILVIMANLSTAAAPGLNYSLAAEKGYGQHQSAGFDILLILTTQMIGFGAGGLCRRFVVWPAAMVWPQNLVFCTLLNTLHAESEDEEKGPSRFRFFLYVLAGAFIWYWVPGFLFVALSAFSWACWIAPNNAVVNQLFGVSSGLGMGLLTFDWSQISYIVSPLVVPWWAEVNVIVAFVLMFWVIAPAMYYTNVWNSAYLPISTTAVFDRYGHPYDTSRVVDTAAMRLNVTAYKEYSPLFLPITYATGYGISFALATAVIVHTALYHGKEIWQRIKRSQKEVEDVHMRLMAQYNEVPDWWYFAFLTIAVGLSIVTVACFPTAMPVWSVLIAIGMGLIYLLPASYVYAMTSYQVAINLIVELVAGYIIPGLPLGNMLFKLYGTNILNLGLVFVQDLKLGHYMKIPPRATFAVQIVSTFVTALVQVGVKRWLVSAVPDLCSPDQSAQLICPYVQTYFSASIIWGLVGPERQFNIGDYYNPILYWMLGGAVVPVFTWLASRRWRGSWIENVNIPVALAGIGLMPPATGINYSSWFLVGFIFQFLMRRRHFRWWSKYNFILSAGLDAGTVISALVIFFTLQLPKGGTIALNWWGNRVFTETADWAGVSFKTPPPEGFGPTSW
ncbi:hypothetical protein JCM10450v2_008189 [Rhodotorula kratochvilovae]